MIGKIITDPKTGEPLDNNGNKLAQSSYNPPKEIKDLYTRVQNDFQTAWALQHRAFNEFDGVSLLERARLDQELFATYVGAEYLPIEKRWRWKGRKNTARNKIISILAHVLAGMLYPFVYAKNDQGDDEKLTAQVMRILIEDCLRKAKYEVKFMNIALTALVNPAVYVNVEWVKAMQKIKMKMADGTYKVKEVVDEILSGLNLYVVPIDEVLLADFYTSEIQRQPYIIRVRRIPYDVARSIYAGKYFDNKGKDLFDYVEAGKTKVILAGQDNQTLFDIEWTEADSNYVQVLNIQYRQEDLELNFIGGVFLGNEKDPYNSNPFVHRRFVLSGDEWCTIPVYNLAMSGFEPIDPTGRFAFFKSAAFKEFWDDKALNQMHRLALDGTALEVMKPLFISGLSKADSTVLAPGATVGLPKDSSITPFQLGTNLKAAYDAIETQRRDMSESTQDPIMAGNVEKGVTAYATSKAEQNARIFLGVFGLMISNLVTQIGELSMDLVIANMTTPMLDTTVPGDLAVKYNTYLAKGKEKGKNVNNKIIFDDGMIGKNYSDDEIKEKSWELYEKTGKDHKERENSDQRIYMVNPYKFARTTYTLYIDPDKIIRKSMGLERQEKITAFNIMTDPRVAPFTDQKAVVEDFAIEEFGGNNPDRYKKKDEGGDDLLNSMMLQGRTGSPPVASGAGAGAPLPPLPQESANLI